MFEKIQTGRNLILQAMFFFIVVVLLRVVVLKVGITLIYILAGKDLAILLFVPFLYLVLRMDYEDSKRIAGDILYEYSLLRNGLARDIPS